jgi:hypothetical protein
VSAPVDFADLGVSWAELEWESDDYTGPWKHGQRHDARLFLADLVEYYDIVDDDHVAGVQSATDAELDVMIAAARARWEAFRVTHAAEVRS